MLEETQLDMGLLHWVTQRKQFIVLNAIHPPTALSERGGFMNEEKRELNGRKETAGFLKQNSWRLGHKGRYLCGTVVGVEDQMIVQDL